MKHGNFLTVGLKENRSEKFFLRQVYVGVKTIDSPAKNVNFELKN